MKTILILTAPVLSALILLSGCRTGQGPSPHRPSPNSAKAAPRNAAAPPYYRTNAEGRYYYSDGEVTNEDYRSSKLRRNHPARR